MSLRKLYKSHHPFFHRFERYADIHTFFLVCSALLLFALLFLSYGVRGSTTANFSMTILPQPLAVNMVDSEYSPIDEPRVDFVQLPYTRDCREVTARLASPDQQVYVRNFDAADTGWTVTISTESPTATWTSGDYAFDFNDPTGDGCVDGDDADALAGSMEIYTESATLDSGLCPACTTNSVHRISAGVFDENEGVNSVTLAYATADSDNRGDWRLSDIMVRQSVPASQPASGEYEIPLMLSITAN